MAKNRINSIFFKKNSHYHVVNYSICAATFTSSDWSTHVFVTGHVTNVINMPRKVMVVKAKQRQKVGDTN